MKPRSKSPPEVLLHRDLSTNQQVRVLLGICNTMLGALVNPDREHENIPGKAPMAGEARVAAETTFMNACDRLDKIIANDDRWGIEYQLRLEQQYNDRHLEQMKLMHAQQMAEEQRKISAQIVVSPQFRYKPNLVKLEDGSWLAFLGDPEHLESGIVGQGASPSAALASFDQSFSGKMSPELQKWLKQREKDLEDGVVTLTPFPSNESQDMDTSRVEETDRDEGPANSGGGDRSEAGEDSDSD